MKRLLLSYFTFLSIQLPIAVQSLTFGQHPRERSVIYYKEQGKSYYVKKDFPKAAMAYQNCIKVARVQQDWFTLGKCLNNLSAVAFQQGDYQKQIHLLRQAIYTYQQLQSDSLLAESYINLGLAFKRLDIYDSAIVNYYEGIQLLEQQQESTSLMVSYNMLGNMLRKVESYDKARKYYFKSMHLARVLTDTMQIAMVYNNLGKLSEDTDKPKEAIQYYNKSIALKKSARLKKALGTTYYNLGKAYLVLEENEKAIQYFEQSLQYYQSTSDTMGMAEGAVVLAKAYLAKNDIQKTLQYLKRYEADTSERQFSPILTYNYWKTKRNLLERQGDFEAASAASKRLITLQQALLDTEKQDQITAYEIRFGLAELERKNAAQANQLKLEAIKRRNMFTTAALVFIIVGFLILFLLYNNQMTKKVALRNEALYREMHHRIKNNLALFSGMITYRKRNLTEGRLKNTLHSLGQQLNTMNLTHQSLYFSKKADLGHLDLVNYIEVLVDDLFFASGLLANQYEIDFALASARLEADQSNPLGLIINEVLTNAIKYGKSEDGKLRLSILLEKQDKQLTLIVKDKGKGFDTLKVNKNEGMRLIDLLAKSLKAQYTYKESDRGGVEFSIQFTKSKTTLWA